MNIVKSINSVLTKGDLLLHIEPTSTAIKSVLKINYKLYILTKDDKTPKEILFFSFSFVFDYLIPLNLYLYDT